MYASSVFLYLPCIDHHHVFRLGDNYAEAKANSFPAGQKKLWFFGGPTVDKVIGKSWMHFYILDRKFNTAAVVGDDR